MLAVHTFITVVGIYRVLTHMCIYIISLTNVEYTYFFDNSAVTDTEWQDRLWNLVWKECSFEI